MNKLNPEEEKTIKALGKLAKTWPSSLWLFAQSGNLLVMKKLDGERVYHFGGSPNSKFIVGTIDIECDGGDF